MSKEPFEYGGYHFIPERQLKGAEAGFFAMSRKIRLDKELGFCEEGYVYPSKYPYSHESFMAASTDKNCDLYRCVENGNLYIPCHHDLQIYQELPMKTFEVTITETLSLTLKVKAETREEAEAMVAEKYHNEDYVLGADNFKDVEFTTKELTRNRERSER